MNFLQQNHANMRRLHKMRQKGAGCHNMFTPLPPYTTKFDYRIWSLILNHISAPIPTNYALQQAKHRYICQILNCLNDFTYEQKIFFYGLSYLDTQHNKRNSLVNSIDTFALFLHWYTTVLTAIAQSAHIIEGLNAEILCAESAKNTTTTQRLNHRHHPNTIVCYALFCDVLHFLFAFVQILFNFGDFGNK